MTLGGTWGIVPDLPRVFVWFPSLPFAEKLGGQQNEDRLLSDIFCFHASLDAQPREFALLGLAIILLLYNLVIFIPLLRNLARSPTLVHLRRWFTGQSRGRYGK